MRRRLRPLSEVGEMLRAHNGQLSMARRFCLRRGLGQIRSVQRRCCRDRRWRGLGTVAWSGVRALTTRPAQYAGSAGKTTFESTTGTTACMRSRAGGARFTGASASLNLVSGRSTRGITDAQTDAPRRKRIRSPRNRFTTYTPSSKKNTPASLRCQ